MKAYHISSTLFYGDDGSMVDDLQDLYANRIRDFSAQQIFSAWRALPDSTTKHQTKEFDWKSHFDPARFLPKPAIKSATDMVAKSETPPANELEVARYWEARLPKNIRAKIYPDDTSSGPGPGSLESFCYREGCLWVETDFEWYADYGLANGGGETKLVNQRVFFQVNLNTLQSTPIPVNNDFYHPQDESPFAGPFQTFEVYSNSLYISSDDGIKRYSLRDKTWESLPVPVGGYARITALDGRIFLTSESAIIAMSPDGQASEVLASVRRRPARTILDKMDNYLDNYSYKLFAPILPGPKGAVVVFLKGQFYLLAPGASDWKRWTEIPEGREAELTFSPEGLLILSSSDAMAP
ncbi:MAG: hypothetical protein ACRD41_16715, partial [Candidatus Acidiferrales bacterium]